MKDIELAKINLITGHELVDLWEVYYKFYENIPYPGLMKQLRGERPWERSLESKKQYFDFAGSNEFLTWFCPEAFLAPKHQLELAHHIFTNMQNKRQITIFTYSELFFLRAKKLIREGVLDHSDIATIYVDSNDDGEHVYYNLRLTKDGKFLDNWPNGFFEEGFDELFGPPTQGDE